MIVIAKRNTKRIIKGHRYEVDRIFVNNRVVIKGIGSFQLSGFTDINGNEITPIDWTSPSYNPPIYQKIEFSDLKKGDILVCRSGNYKLFLKDKMYKISDLKIKEIEYNSWSGIKTRNEEFIKFHGVNRWIKLNSWSFRKLNTNESRDLALNDLLGNEDSSIIVDSKIRGIDVIEDKEKELIKILAKSMLDPSRHHLTVVEWACSKIANNLKVVPSDFDPYLNLTLHQIMEKLNN
jgi:hypothetical protein